MDAWALLSDVVILLAAALLVGGIFVRFGQSPLIGYILAGMVIGGPGSMRLVHAPEAVEQIAELGVALLLFSLGLEFAWNQIRQLGARLLLAAVLQVIITTILGAGGAMLAGLGVKESIAIGTMVSLSSTAVVMRMIMERAEGDSVHGRNCIGVLLVQDMAVVPLAMLVTILGGSEQAGDMASNVGKIFLMIGILIIGLYFFLNKIAIHALGTLTLERNRELTIILAVVTALGSAWAAHWAGASPALGAFVAGMFLGNSPFATQIRADISSLRVILLTLFFGAAGMVADPSWIFSHWDMVLTVSLILMFGKTLITSGILRLTGQSAPVSIASGLCLSQIGEFAFVLGSIGLGVGVVRGETYQLIVSVAVVTLAVSPLLVPVAPAIGVAITNLLSGSSLSINKNRKRKTNQADVVIIGFGPAGEIASQAFSDSPERVLVIELNRQNAKKAREAGFAAHIGDASLTDVLEHAGIDSASTVVITLPHLTMARRALVNVRRLAPHAHVIVRSRYQRHKDEFLSAGAHVVLGDEEQVGKSLGEHLTDRQQE